MAVRQYIGARYVTKIYENSLDPSSAEWESGVTYEPLTLVTYNNSSYLSKRDVPAAIGDPAANPTYWVVTGAYNGQIAQLQSDVSTLQTDVTNIEKSLAKRYIFIGDSYGHSSGTYNGWIDKLVVKMGLTAGDYFDAGVGGGGFAVATVANQFGTALASIISSMTADDKLSISDVVVLGGANDTGNDVPTLASAINSFIAQVNADLPNAEVHIGMCAGNYTNNFTGVQSGRTRDGYLAGSGYSYINNIEYLFHDRTLIGADKIHPTDGGYERLANFVFAYLTGRSMSVGYRAESTLTATDGTLTGSPKCFAVVDNNVTTARIDYFEFEFDTAQNVGYLHNVDTKVNLNNPLIMGIQTRSSGQGFSLSEQQVVGSFYSEYDSAWHNLEITFAIYDGDIWIGNTSGASVSNLELAMRQVKKIILPPHTLVIPSMYC